MRPLLCLIASSFVGCGCSEIDLWGDAGQAEDPAPEASLDAATEPATCQPSTGAGECNVLEQCCCSSTSWCRADWTCGDLGPGPCERCIPGPIPILEIGELCGGPLHPACRPGTTCWSEIYGGSDNVCYEWCVTDDDCSLPGTECVLERYNGTDTTVPFPIHLCTLP